MHFFYISSVKKVQISYLVCGGYLRNRQGTLTSPGYPQNYPENIDCSWVIESRPGRTLQFEFLSLDIQSEDDQCQQDYIQVDH